MHKSILFLESAGAGNSAYRAVIKTRHGRTLYLALELSEGVCSIVECFYTDRGQGRQKRLLEPKMLKTRR